MDEGDHAAGEIGVHAYLRVLLQMAVDAGGHGQLADFDPAGQPQRAGWLALSLLVTITIEVALMTWWLMPLVTRRLAVWIHPTGKVPHSGGQRPLCWRPANAPRP